MERKRAIRISDHAPLTIKIGLKEKQKVRRWRFNPNIFLQQKDREDLRRGIQQYFKENKESAKEDIIWDAAKAVIRGMCMNKDIYFRRKREQDLKEITEIQRKLQGKFEKKSKEQLNRLKDELQELDNFSLWKKEILVKNEYQGINIKRMKSL